MIEKTGLFISLGFESKFKKPNNCRVARWKMPRKSELVDLVAKSFWKPEFDFSIV